MMLVASLFISGSYDRIAGYAPGSQVTDHNAVDLDQKVMEDHLSAGDFAKALNVYAQGGNSKSYAALLGVCRERLLRFRPLGCGRRRVRRGHHLGRQRERVRHRVRRRSPQAR